MHQPVDDDLVEIVTAKVRIPVCGKHFKHPVTQFQNGNVVCAATQIENNNFLVDGFFIHAVSQSCCCRLIDDALHLEACNLSGFFRGLALRIVEVGRNGYYRTGDLRTEVVLSSFLHFLQCHRRNFLRRVEAVIDFYTGGVVVAFDHFVRHTANLCLNLVERTSHEPLDAVYGFFRIGNCLPFGRLAYFTFTAVNECDDGRSRSFPFCVGDDHGFVAFHDGHAAVGGSQVYSNDFAHSVD